MSEVGVYALYFNSKTDGWACGLSSIHHWDGNEWTRVFTDYSVWFQDIYFTGPNDGWAVAHESYDGQAEHFHYDGTEWTRITDPVIEHIGLDAVHFVDANWGWAINGGTYFYDGNKWTRYEDDSSWSKEDIYCVSKNDVWIALASHEYFLHFSGF
jgi:hypothetical protein